MINESIQVREQGESLGELLSNLASHSAGLVQDEFMLARQEIRQKVKLYQSALLLVFLGGVVGILALGTLCAAFILWLGHFMEFWLAAGITGLVLGVVGAIIGVIARNEIKNLTLTPEKTLQTLEENKEWLKDMN